MNLPSSILIQHKLGSTERAGVRRPRQEGSAIRVENEMALGAGSQDELARVRSSTRTARPEQHKTI